MARLCEGVTKEGRVRLYPDEINIIKRALRKLLLPDKKRAVFTPKDEMLIINTYHKLVYKDEKTTANRADIKTDKGKA